MTMIRSKTAISLFTAMAALALALPLSALWHDDEDDCPDGCSHDDQQLSIRCMTLHPTLKAMEQLEKSHKLWKEDRAAKGAAVSERAAGSVTIPVWFHVINQGSGLSNGDLPQSQIDAQIKVLNDSYSGATGGAATPFKFQLVGVTRTTNSSWFHMGIGTAAEAGAKAALKVGGADTLNIYSA